MSSRFPNFLKTGFTLNEVIQAIAISSIIITVYYFWFAIADRSYLFLYGHFGWGPFHTMTAGRYWMTGFVLSAFITIIYALFNLIILKTFSVLGRTYKIPSWIHIWLICQPVIATGILIITMNLNSPVMPLDITIMCILAMSAGLAVGFYNSEILMTDAKRFFVISLNGLGLVPVLLLIRVLELPSREIMSVTNAIAICAGSIIFSLLWLIIVSIIFIRKKINSIKSYEILLSGFLISYLLLPIMHYLFATPPGRPYITASDNFFPDSFYLKIGTWIIAAILAFAAVEFRKRKTNKIIKTYETSEDR